MHVRFIGQNFDPARNLSIGDLLIQSLANDGFSSFSAFVAFLSVDGFANLSKHLRSFKEDEGKIRIFVGVDLQGTSKEALEMLLESDFDSYVVYSPNRVVFHPKIFSFEGDERC